MGWWRLEPLFLRNPSQCRHMSIIVQKSQKINVYIGWIKVVFCHHTRHILYTASVAAVNYPSTTHQNPSQCRHISIIAWFGHRWVSLWEGWRSLLHQLPRKASSMGWWSASDSFICPPWPAFGALLSLGGFVFLSLGGFVFLSGGLVIFLLDNKVFEILNNFDRSFPILWLNPCE